MDKMEQMSKMEQVEKCMEIAETVAAELEKIDDLRMLMATLGMVLDIWAAEMGASPAEMNEMLQMLTVAHKEVNEMLGDLGTGRSS